MKLSIAIGMLACAIAYGCGDDDDDSAGSCPTDAKAGDKVSCHCGDAGVGQATCKNDGKLGSCMCDGDGGSAGSGSGGSGGKSGSGMSGNGGSSASGSGGSSGSSGEDDGGVADEDSGVGQQQQPPPTTPAVPTDGNQFTACTKDRDCNRNLGCYSPEAGGFCSAVCERDEDCAALKPSGFHCSTTGVCALTCMNAGDTASCPPGMMCTAVGGGGGGELRCLYPTQMAEPRGAAFAQCQGGGGSCMDGLMCAGAVMGNPGFCTHSCTPQDSDCSDVVPASGTISASCVPQNPELGTCALDCEAMTDGCPDGMDCVEAGFYHVCMYMN
jgi:hypothetical protein